MSRPVSFAEVLSERIEALRVLHKEGPDYADGVFEPADSVAAWEGAYARLQTWARDTLRKVRKYDGDLAADLEAVSSSHCRYDAEEEFGLDSQKFLALLSAAAQNPENTHIFPMTSSASSYSGAPAEWAAPAGPPTSVFISHSSRDKELASLVVSLLVAAVRLRKADIRCTSVPGCRLPAGAEAGETLAAEIRSAAVFIGLVTFDSVESPYFLFELGARWGNGQRLMPVLGPSAGYDLLPAPVGARNALSTTKRDDLHQLVREVSGVLGAKVEPPEYYHSELEALVSHQAPKEPGDVASSGKTGPGSGGNVAATHFRPHPEDVLERAVMEARRAIPGASSWPAELFQDRARMRAWFAAATRDEKGAVLLPSPTNATPGVFIHIPKAHLFAARKALIEEAEAEVDDPLAD